MQQETSQTETPDEGGGDDLSLSETIAQVHEELSAGADEDATEEAEKFDGDGEDADDDDDADDASADGEGDEDAEDDDLDGDEDDEDDADEEGDDADDDPDGAPSDLNAKERAAFAKLDDNGRKLLFSYAKRSQNSRSKLSNELKSLKDEVGPIGDALRPYQQALRENNIDAGAVVKGLMPYYAHLALGTEDQKRQAINALVKSFNVELDAPQNEDEFEDELTPREKALSEQVEKLTARLDRTDEQTMTAAQRQAADAVDAFKNEKDENGKLKYPFFDQLEAEMTRLYQAGVASDLPTLYKKALRLNDELSERAKLQSRRAKRKAADAKAKKAKRQNAVNRRSSARPSKRSPGGSNDIGDDVLAALDELTGAA